MLKKFWLLSFLATVTISNQAFCQTTTSPTTRSGSAFVQELADALNDQDIRWSFSRSSDTDNPSAIRLFFNQSQESCVANYIIDLRGNNPLLGYDYYIAGLSQTQQLAGHKVVSVFLEANADPIAQTISVRLDGSLNQLYENGPGSVGSSTNSGNSNENYLVPNGSGFLLEDILLGFVNTAELTLHGHSSDTVLVNAEYVLTPDFRMQIHQATWQLGMIFHHLFRAVSLMQHLPSGQQAKDNLDVRTALNAVRRVCTLRQRTSSSPRSIPCNPTLMPRSTLFLDSPTAAHNCR